MPRVPMISAPVGKSGPLISRITASSISSRFASGCASTHWAASATSRRLCGGIWVAMPTAMPERAVDEQVREAARQHVGLEGLAVVVGAEVDGLLVDVAHHLHGQRRHPALGVPRGGGRVVARAAEVALALDQRVAQAPVLHEAHQGVVDRLVTVRVVGTHDLTDDAAALVEAAVGAVATVVHRVDDPAVHGLEAVAHVGERPADDDAHGVLDVRPLHLGVEVDRLGAVGLDRRLLSHRVPCLCWRSEKVKASWSVRAQMSSLCLRDIFVSARSSLDPQMSRKRTSRALRWMKERRDSTSSPIRIEKISSAAAASSRVTCSSTRESGFIVVSHSSW